MIPYPKKIKEKVRELYGNGMRPKLISDRMMISLTTISVWVRDLPKTALVGRPEGGIPWNKGRVFKQMIGNNHAVKENIKENSSRYRARMIIKKIEPCEICNKRKKKYQMVIHHKDENVYNNDIKNLQRLCRSCHINVHREKLSIGKLKKS